MCDQFLERESAAQTILVIHHIYIIDLIHILGLHPHLLDAFRHTPVLVDHDHFRTHKTAGGVFVIFEKVDDVTGLFYVVNVAQDLVAFFLVEFLNDIHGIVRVEMFDLLGDVGRIHLREELGAVILIEFHEDSGLHLLIEEFEQIFRLVEIQILIKLCYVGGVKVGKFFRRCCIGVIMDDVAQMFEVFRGEFFHSYYVEERGVGE